MINDDDFLKQENELKDLFLSIVEAATTFPDPQRVDRILERVRFENQLLDSQVDDSKSLMEDQGEEACIAEGGPSGKTSTDQS